MSPALALDADDNDLRSVDVAPAWFFERFNGLLAMIPIDAMTWFHGALIPPGVWSLYQIFSIGMGKRHRILVSLSDFCSTVWCVSKTMS